MPIRLPPSRARNEQMLSGLPPKADLGSALRPSINNTVDGLVGFSRRSRPHAARRASDREIASRHLPHGSGDVGIHEGARPVHEVQEGLVIHPRGHRAAAAAGGGAALGMDSRPTAKAVTEPEARRPDLSPPSPVADGRGLAVRPSGARPFDGRTSRMGDTRYPTGTGCLVLEGNPRRLFLPAVVAPVGRRGSRKTACDMED
jgi:hypothetical protein